ncbi:MAG: triose-phosphate isomerase, partial [Caulobacter sp.]
MPSSPCVPPLRMVVGNWKMNGGATTLGEVESMVAAFAGHDLATTVALCPPATMLAAVSKRLAATALLTGGQDCHAESEGAFTGSISARMLAEAGASMVILGHSERRLGLSESDFQVASKVRAAVENRLVPIICVGETAAQRQCGAEERIVVRQLRESLPACLGDQAFAVAYEPVWAIGSGRRASHGEIERMVAVIRQELLDHFPAGPSVSVLYGGSVSG